MGPQPWSEGFRDLSSRGRDTTLVQIDRNPHLRILEWPYKPSQSKSFLIVLQFATLRHIDSFLNAEYFSG